jgi:chemotaxis protein histidine kinase CheA
MSTQVGVLAHSLFDMREENADQTALLKKAEGIAHQIKGSSGTMGYSEVSSVAANLEQNLKRLEKERMPLTDTDLHPPMELLAALQRLARETTPIMSALYHADIARLTRHS